ncbi:MAG: TonB-dependent receptor [Gammaproteobacteria bacterium]|nr:TonB-dependent receptor [Gammaproteobacteria bacterium]
MTVTATRSENPGNVSGSYDVITSKEIDDSGATNIVDVLRTRGGIQILDFFGIGGAGATISMRGFGENAGASTLVMVDGRRLNNNDLGTPDLSTVALKDIERIEILRGSAGALYGDQAVGGVINIITRKPGEFRFLAKGEYGSYDRAGASASVSQRLANGLGYRFSAEKRDSDNYRDNNAQDYENVFGMLDFAYTTGRVFAEYQHINEDLETPGALTQAQLQSDRRQAANPGDFVDTDTDNFRLGIEQDLLADWGLRMEFARRFSESDSILSVGGVPFPNTTKRDIREFTPRLTGAVPLPTGDANITAGVDIFRTDFRLVSPFGITDSEQSRDSVYVQTVVPLFPNLDMTAGYRHARVESDIVNTAAFPAVDDTFKDNVNAFNIGLNWSLSPEVRAFVRFDRNYRFILADEFSVDFSGNLVPEDNQTGRSFEAGFDWQGNRGGIAVTAYRLLLENEIVFNPLGGPFGFGANENIGDTGRTGFIVDANFQPIRDLTLNASFSYVDADIESGSLAGGTVPLVAEETATVSANYNFPYGVDAYLEVHGTGERAAATDYFNNGETLPGYVLLNGSLSYSKGPFRLALRGNNLLDKEYSTFASFSSFSGVTSFFPAPERNFMLTATYTYD